MTVLKDDKSSLLKDAGINDGARKVSLRGKEVIVPLKFDADGNPASIDRLIFKRLSLNDLRFLSILRRCEWDVAKAVSQAGIVFERGEKLLKKLACFREEDARVKALCEIPTPDWIAAKHVENIYNPTLEDSQQKSLAELAKIEGAYKNNLQVTVTQNVFNLPKYDPETEKKLKEIADREAIIIQEAEVVNG